MSQPRRVPVALCAVVVASLLGAPPASAHPPLHCGTLPSKSRKTLYVRAHYATCPFARKWMRRYIAHHRGPSGWHCGKPPFTHSPVTLYCRFGISRSIWVTRLND
jgi:hypothetical protein